MTDQPFKYDVFLSYSTKDKKIVHTIAERLKKDGVRVWWDQWIIKPGDSIPALIEGGLESARILVLYMSANAFASEWSQLESHTFRFRDPQNKERRFIPLRLDNAKIKGSLAQFAYIDWSNTYNHQQEYAKLLDACGFQKKLAKVETPDASTQSLVKSIQLGVASYYDDSVIVDSVWSYAFSTDGKYAIICPVRGKTAQLWGLEARKCLHILKGHTKSII